jgi:hypothetical protein
MATKSLSGITAALLVGLAVFGCAHEMSGIAGPGWVTLFDGKNNGFLVTNQSYQDFELHAEFWVSHDANSGIYMRCQSGTVLTDKTCYEANIFDERKDPTYGTGAIVHYVEVNPMPKAGGKWNTMELTVKGRQMSVVLNGTKTDELHNAMWTEGPIALQHAAGVIKFRKVAVKPL